MNFDYRKLTIMELHEKLINKETTPLELTKEALNYLKEDDNNAVEYVMEKEALALAESLKEPEVNNPLWGIPFVIKDNMSTKDVPTTASSNILNGYVPVYDAAVVERLLACKAIPIAKSTLDELAMGGTGTTGHLGITFNPYDKEHKRLVGGSSCGSAALTASGVVPFALASDTGDSTRKPASFVGLVGFKPTWSRISRYGLFPFAPSMDTVGVFTRNVLDSALLLNVLAGRDERDSTSSTKPVEDYTSLIGKEVKKNKVAVIKEIYEALSDKEVKDKFLESCGNLNKQGYVVEEVHMDKKLLETLFPTYFVISCAEATSNNANLDGIKFGPYYDGATYEEVMSNARTKGFSELIKRRFVIGSYVLMHENQKELFVRAQKNRHKVVDEINKIFKDYDFIYTPAAPSIAPNIGEASDRLSSEYLIADNHLCIGNFAGLPSITLPIGMKNNMPYGANLSGRPFEEVDLLQCASKLEETTSLKGIVALKEER